MYNLYGIYNFVYIHIGKVDGNDGVVAHFHIELINIDL